MMMQRWPWRGSRWGVALLVVLFGCTAPTLDSDPTATRENALPVATQLTGGPSTDQFAELSPDGALSVFVSDRNGTP